jgi:flagellar motor switch protein FliN/FliY
LKGSVSNVTERGAAVMNPTADADKDATESSPEAVPVDALALLRDVEVELTLEIGRRRMRIADVVKLGPGRMVELDKQAGEPLELLVNGRLIGRGEAVVVGDRYGIRITVIVPPEGGGR